MTLIEEELVNLTSRTDLSIPGNGSYCLYLIILSLSFYYLGINIFTAHSSIFPVFLFP